MMDYFNKVTQNSNHKTINVSIKTTILFSDIINVIKNENGIEESLDHHHCYDSYEFDEALETYPMIINEILIVNYNNQYTMKLIINENIETIPGSELILLDYDDIIFSFEINIEQLYNIMINLIPFLPK